MIEKTSSESDAYLTLSAPACAELKIKGSRFIGLAAPATGPDQALAVVSEESRRYHDATHHCYAFRTGIQPPSVSRYSDAGEPSGTAGKPILEALDGLRLTNTVCVVTRYFGGVKLGTGGLSRAYGRCAAQTLEAAQVEKKYITDSMTVIFEYGLTGQIMNLVSRFDCRIRNTQYSERTRMTLLVRRSLVTRIRQELMDQTAGRIEFISGEKHLD